MKKVSGWIVVLGIIVILVLWGIRKYNAMVTAEEKVSKAWAQVENVYQRRADLIPNLVATVKGYAQHEEGTLTAVIEARAKATQTTVDPSNLTPEQIANFQSAQSELGSAIGRLLVSVEQYPDLKANQNFLELQAQLEGSENRIAVERKNFNEAAMEFNTYIRRFPANIIASIFGFDKKGYFEAQEGADVVPQVNFD